MQPGGAKSRPGGAKYDPGEALYRVTYKKPIISASPGGAKIFAGGAPPPRAPPLATGLGDLGGYSKFILGAFNKF